MITAILMLFLVGLPAGYCFHYHSQLVKRAVRLRAIREQRLRLERGV
jgi:hypothetical protein